MANLKQDLRTLVPTHRTTCTFAPKRAVLLLYHRAVTGRSIHVSGLAGGTDHCCCPTNRVLLVRSLSRSTWRESNRRVELSLPNALSDSDAPKTNLSTHWIGHLLIAISLAIVAGKIAVVTSREGDTAFLSANDRSRWCTVASLVEDNTFAIDRQMAIKIKPANDVPGLRLIVCNTLAPMARSMTTAANLRCFPFWSLAFMADCSRLGINTHRTADLYRSHRAGFSEPATAVDHVACRLAITSLDAVAAEHTTVWLSRRRPWYLPDLDGRFAQQPFTCRDDHRSDVSDLFVMFNQERQRAQRLVLRISWVDGCGHCR